MDHIQRSRFDSLHTKLQQIYLELQRRVIALNVDWYVLIASGYRSRDAQDSCNIQGTSRAIWPSSPHNVKQSLAVDIHCMRGDKVIRGEESDKVYDKIAELFLKIAMDKGIAVTWGGSFKTPEKGHFELTKEWAALKRNNKKQGVRT
jgi:hypothetical protein